MLAQVGKLMGCRHRPSCLWPQTCLPEAQEVLVEDIGRHAVNVRTHSSPAGDSTLCWSADIGQVPVWIAAFFRGRLILECAALPAVMPWLRARFSRGQDSGCERLGLTCRQRWFANDTGVFNFIFGLVFGEPIVQFFGSRIADHIEETQPRLV